MDEKVLRHEREQAIHLIRSGRSIKEVAEILHRSEQWVRKWWKRYQENGWTGLKSRSRRPHRLTKKLPESIRQAVIKARSELEALASTDGGLKFIGSAAVRTRLKEQGITPLPSKRSIERILKDAGMTRPYCRAPQAKDTYPHLTPTQPHTLVQVDIYPRYLKGGQSIACFNAIDVVSRHPVCKAYRRRRSIEAVDFLQTVMQTIGVPRYIQMDNEGCFSGGHTHAGVIGKSVRVALMAGAEAVFSPIRHPQSQGYVERFHRTYGRHVWEDTLLADISQVNRKGHDFVAKYVKRSHPGLAEQTPLDVHRSLPARRLPATFSLPETLSKTRIPLYEGKVHFMRKVDEKGNITLLNKTWRVPGASVGQGVWATLTITSRKSFVTVFDKAPDAPKRTRFVRHPFPVNETVLPLPATSENHSNKVSGWLARMVSAVRNDVLAVISDVKVPKIETMS